MFTSLKENELLMVSTLMVECKQILAILGEVISFQKVGEKVNLPKMPTRNFWSFYARIDFLEVDQFS
jgi:hypothetical protein